MPGGNATAVWHFRIEGMGGPICALLVGEVLRALPGVVSAEAEVGFGGVVYDPRLCAPAAVEDALRDVGYAVRDQDLRGGGEARAA